MSLKNFKIMKKLGEGSFGVVQKVIRIQDNQQYAMKKVKYMKLKQKDKKNALNQIRILASIDHPNVIKYKQAFFQESQKLLCTVMELAPNGDLSSRIKQKIKNNSSFYQYQIWAIGKGIINGIGALHQKNIIHRDIKPANIFFGEGDVAKIGDLNVSVLMKSSLAYTQTGTPYYASPEVWSNQPYAFQSDIWSFGCVLYEMCALRKPFEAKNIDCLYEKIKKLKYNPLPCRFSYDLINVIQKCLSFRNKRISLKQLKRTFQLYNAPQSYISQGIRSQSSLLMQTIKMPLNKKDFSICLPKPKYVNPEQKSQPGTETSIQQNPSILNKFMIPQNRLGPNAPLNSLNAVRSQKFIRPVSRIEHKILQSPSFKDVISYKSPQKSSRIEIIGIEQLKQRRRKIQITQQHY